MKITIKQTIEKEVQVPHYFMSDEKVYRHDGDEKFTCIYNYNAIKITVIRKGDDGSMINWDDITIISQNQFKAVFLTAIAEIAGFEIDTWEDLESDVQAKSIGK